MKLKPFVAALSVSAVVAAGAMVLPAAALDPPAGAQAKKTATCTLKITGMTCAGCEAAVKIAAKKVDGVSAASVSYEKGQAEISYDPARTTPGKIAKAITEGSGFKAEVTQKPK